MCHLWDIFTYNSKLLLNDISDYKFNAISSFPSVSKFFDTIQKKFDTATLINEKEIIINEDTEVRAGTIIDATKAPVIIGKNVIVDIGVLIQGPVFIDDNTYIAPGAKIRAGTFIGKNCKVGGEVSSSVICNFSNKVHDGFLGHSFIGEWVNIGAGTNNSNLKNNYSLVKIRIEDKIYPTEQQFLGSLIGDYTRIAIGTNLNTGTFIGIGANYALRNSKFYSQIVIDNSNIAALQFGLKSYDLLTNRLDVKIEYNQSKKEQYRRGNNKSIGLIEQLADQFLWQIFISNRTGHNETCRCRNNQRR